MSSQDRVDRHQALVDQALEYFDSVGGSIEDPEGLVTTRVREAVGIPTPTMASSVMAGMERRKEIGRICGQDSGSRKHENNPRRTYRAWLTSTGRERLAAKRAREASDGQPAPATAPETAPKAAKPADRPYVDAADAVVKLVGKRGGTLVLPEDRYLRMITETFGWQKEETAANGLSEAVNDGRLVEHRHPGGLGKPSTVTFMLPVDTEAGEEEPQTPETAVEEPRPDRIEAHKSTIDKIVAWLREEGPISDEERSVIPIVQAHFGWGNENYTRNMVGLTIRSGRVNFRRLQTPHSAGNLAVVELSASEEAVQPAVKVPPAPAAEPAPPVEAPAPSVDAPAASPTAEEVAASLLRQTLDGFSAGVVEYLRDSGVLEILGAGQQTRIRSLEAELSEVKRHVHEDHDRVVAELTVAKEEVIRANREIAAELRTVKDDKVGLERQVRELRQQIATLESELEEATAPAKTHGLGTLGESLTDEQAAKFAEAVNRPKGKAPRVGGQVWVPNLLRNGSAKLVSTNGVFAEVKLADGSRHKVLASAVEEARPMECVCGSTEPLTFVAIRKGDCGYAFLCQGCINRLHRWCGDKLQHSSLESATKAAARANTAPDIVAEKRWLVPSVCPWCSTSEQKFWHIGPNTMNGIGVAR